MSLVFLWFVESSRPPQKKGRRRPLSAWFPISFRRKNIQQFSRNFLPPKNWLTSMVVSGIFQGYVSGIFPASWVVICHLPPIKGTRKLHSLPLHQGTPGGSYRAVSVGTWFWNTPRVGSERRPFFGPKKSHTPKNGQMLTVSQDFFCGKLSAFWDESISDHGTRKTTSFWESCNYSLPEQFAPENGWLEYEFFFGWGRPIFRCKLLVCRHHSSKIIMEVKNGIPQY